MTARTLLTAAALFGLTASTFAQDTPAPAATQPLTTPQAQPAPAGVTQSGYAQPMTYLPQNQMYYYPQGQVQQAGYTVQPGVVYTQPMTSGTTSYYPSTGYTSGGTYYHPTYSTQPGVGTYYPTTGTTYYPSTGYAYPSFANGYANMGTSGGFVGNTLGTTSGFVGNVVSYPAKVTRRLFRR